MAKGIFQYGEEIVNDSIKSYKTTYSSEKIETLISQCSSIIYMSPLPTNPATMTKNFLYVNEDGYTFTPDNVQLIQQANTSIEEYSQNVKYKKDALVYLGDDLARVANDFTSDNTRVTTQESFEEDVNNSNLILITHDIPTIPGCLGSVKEDDPTSYPPTAVEGDWVLVENCVNSYPGQVGISIYDGTNWGVIPIPQASISFPEPAADDSLNFRSVATGSSSGQWVAFDSVDGNKIKVNIKSLNSQTDGAYIPQAQEFIWDTDRNILVIGDGATSLLGLRAFYEGSLTSADIITALGYQPEDASMKGQPNGYAPLDANGVVPDANLPASVTNTYSKTEIDSKDLATLNSVTTLVNNEAATARAAEGALRTDLDAHVTNNAIHVTQTEKDTWNDKVDDADLVPFTNHISDTTIHVTQAEKDKWNGMNKAVYVTDVADLPTTDNDIGNMGYVQVTAPGVTPVVCDSYIWDGTAWQLMDVGQVSLQFNWGNLIDRPTSTPLAIDNTVAIAHNHTNKLILDKIGQSAAGNFTYDGVEIGVKALFLANEAVLPTTGEDNTLYVVYEDSRVRGYPSISVWRDGAFQILGRGTQDAPPVVGDMSILQAEYFSVIPDSSFIINVTNNQFFAFMPLEILKETEGAKDEARTITDFTDPADFKYDEQLIKISNINNLRVSIADIPTTLDYVGDKYYSYADIDLTKFKDIEGIQ